MLLFLASVGATSDEQASQVGILFHLRLTEHTNRLMFIFKQESKRNIRILYKKYFILHLQYSYLMETRDTKQLKSSWKYWNLKAPSRQYWVICFVAMGESEQSFFINMILFEVIMSVNAFNNVSLGRSQVFWQKQDLVNMHCSQVACGKPPHGGPVPLLTFAWEEQRWVKYKLMNRNKWLYGSLCVMWMAFNEGETGRKRVKVTDREK